MANYGDLHYVGLNGIQLFDDSGELIAIKQVQAIPESVRVLPDCKLDCRVVTNLLDGENESIDDSHIWLAPYKNLKRDQFNN